MKDANQLDAVLVRTAAGWNFVSLCPALRCISVSASLCLRISHFLKRAAPHSMLIGHSAYIIFSTTSPVSSSGWTLHSSDTRNNTSGPTPAPPLDCPPAA